MSNSPPKSTTFKRLSEGKCRTRYTTTGGRAAPKKRHIATGDLNHITFRQHAVWCAELRCSLFATWRLRTLRKAVDAGLRDAKHSIGLLVRVGAIEVHPRFLLRIECTWQPLTYSNFEMYEKVTAGKKSGFVFKNDPAGCNFDAFSQ